MTYTEPEPDVVVLKPRADDYAGKKKILAEDALLVVEVSEPPFVTIGILRFPDTRSQMCLKFGLRTSRTMSCWSFAAPAEKDTLRR